MKDSLFLREPFATAFGGFAFSPAPKERKILSRETKLTQKGIKMLAVNRHTEEATSKGREAWNLYGLKRLFVFKKFPLYHREGERRQWHVIHHRKLEKTAAAAWAAH